LIVRRDRSQPPREWIFPGAINWGTEPEHSF
jgi:hypothetical protein